MYNIYNIHKYNYTSTYTYIYIYIMCIHKDFAVNTQFQQRSMTSLPSHWLDRRETFDVRLTPRHVSERPPFPIPLLPLPSVWCDLRRRLTPPCRVRRHFDVVVRRHFSFSCAVAALQSPAHGQFSRPSISCANFV